VFSALLGSEHNPCPTQIVGRHLNRYLVSWQDSDVVHPHLAGDVSEHHMTIFQFDPESGIGEVFNNLSLHLDDIVLCHAPNQPPGAILKLAFLSSDSYC